MTEEDLSATPLGVLERMELNMEMQVGITACYNLLATLAGRYRKIKGEEWRADYLMELATPLFHASECSPISNTISRMVDRDIMKEFVEWRKERKENEV